MNKFSKLMSAGDNVVVSVKSNDSYFKGWRAWRIYVLLTFFLLSRRYKQIVCIKSCTYFIFPLSKDVSLITWHKVDILKINNSTKFVSFCSFRIDKLTKVTWRRTNLSLRTWCTPSQWWLCADQYCEKIVLELLWNQEILSRF